jgi:hypothetical protein
MKKTDNKEQLAKLLRAPVTREVLNSEDQTNPQPVRGPSYCGGGLKRRKPITAYKLRSGV